MNKYELIPVGSGDIKKEWILLTSLGSANGFENSAFGCSFEQYKDTILPKWNNDAKGINLPNGYVPQTTFILYVDGDPVGVFKVRHYCNEVTRINGAGHIGYGIRADYRGNGYATKGLELAINKLIDMPDYDKKDGVIMGYRKNNPASGRVQANNGAEIIGETDEDYITQIKIN